MDSAITIACVVLGLALGGLVGYRLGTEFRGQRGMYWTLTAVAVALSAGLNFAGLMTGNHRLAYAALGLMGGLITGLKYGYSDMLTVWPEEESDDTAGGEPAESPQGGAAEECASEDAHAEHPQPGAGAESVARPSDTVG